MIHDILNISAWGQIGRKRELDWDERKNKEKPEHSSSLPTGSECKEGLHCK
jgi:hypothetical protein